jgi:isopenicillin-N N-acyltransferase-like protein
MNTHEMPVLELTGTPHQRGQAHGEALRVTIHEHIARTKAFFEENTKKNPDQVLDELLAETDFLTAIRKWTPDLLEELEGIAEGANADFNSIYALNLSDETWWYFYEKQGMFSSKAVGAENCSCIGVAAQGGMPAMVAQNLDLIAYFDGMQVLLHIKDEENSLETLAFSFAGEVGAIGVNNHSVGMCENTLISLKHAKDGLPVTFVSRGILGQSTLEDAISFVHRVKHASGQNYIIGSPDGVVDYECSANKVRRYLPGHEESPVCHTNHPFINDDSYALEKKPENSMARFASVETSLRIATMPITVETIQKALSSHDSEPNAVCVHPDEDGKGGITTNSVVYELGQTARVHYTAGPPCSTAFKTIELSQ